MIIVRVSKHATKRQRKVEQLVSAPRSVKVVKPKASQEEKSSETKTQPSTIVRQVRNVRPLTPVAAMLAWNSLFQTGVA